MISSFVFSKNTKTLHSSVPLQDCVLELSLVILQKWTIFQTVGCQCFVFPAENPHDPGLMLETQLFLVSAGEKGRF